MKRTTSALAAAIAAAILTQSAQVHAADSIAEAVTAGKASLSFRVRHEGVEIDNVAKEQSSAFTLRTRLNYATSLYMGFGAFLEFDDVTAIDDADYATSKAYKAKQSASYIGETIIADPEGSEVNQAYLTYGMADTLVKYGRQRILLDNQRFVGGVGFRQNEQTYDALSIRNESLADTSIFFAHINNVNRIFGENDPYVSDTESSSNLLNIKYSGFKAGSLSVYSYQLDETASDTQYDTTGLRFIGSRDALGYTLEYASQDKELANGVSYRADYSLLEASYHYSGVKFTVGRESLGSDGGAYGFATPLATAHKFQGWADQFLGTPRQGINDIYLSLGGVVSGVKLLAVYHDFSADHNNSAGDSDLGSEFGLLAIKKFGPYSLSAKYASYSDGDDSFNKADVDKLWLTASADF